MVKTGNILDKDCFLCQHYHSEASKKIVKAFEDSGLIKLVTFDYGKVHKKEVAEFYVNATVIGNGQITSKVGGVDVIITAKDIRSAFELPEASDLDASSHNFNKKDL